MPLVQPTSAIDHRNFEAYRRFKERVFRNLYVDLGMGGRVSYLDGVNGSDGRGPNVAQQKIHFEDWRFGVFPLGRRSGKTIGAAAEAVGMAGVPNTKTWVNAPNYGLTDRCFGHVWKWMVVDECYGPDSIVERSFVRDRRIIRTKWGSTIEGKSAQSPESLKGEQLDLIIIDEAAMIPENIWLEYLRPCLSDRQGRAMFISTPRGRDWFHDYFERRLDREMAEMGWGGVTMKSWDNPFFPEGEEREIRHSTNEAIVRREYEASFEHFTGLIWPMFRDRLYDAEYPGRGGHVVPAWSIPKLGTNYRAIDVGWRHPTACVWGRVVPPRGDLYIYRVYLGEESTAHETHAREISARTQEPIFLSWISPDSKSKRKIKEREESLSVWEIYRDTGIQCRPAQDKVDAGCAKVASYMLATRQDNPNHPKLFISEECKELLSGRQSIGNYIFADRAAGNSHSAAPERPRKNNDDLVDGLRYLCAGKPTYVPASQQGAARRMLEDDSLRYGYPRKRSSRPQANYGRPRIMGLNG